MKLIERKLRKHRSATESLTWVPAITPNRLTSQRITTTYTQSVRPAQSGAQRTNLVASRHLLVPVPVQHDGQIRAQARAKFNMLSSEGETPPSPKKRFAVRREDIPNLLTYVRIIAIPLLVIAGIVPSFVGQHITTATIFIIASITDWLDGYLARKWKVITPMGIFLDPVADKLIVCVALIMLTARFATWPITASTCIIITREIFVSALREWMAIRQKSAVVKVSNIGKWKTASQMMSLSILLGVSYLYWWYSRIAILLLMFSAFLALLSAVDYVRAAANALKES